MRGKKCWKRVTAVLMAFMMLVGLVMTNGITSEAYWYNSEGERYPNVGYSCLLYTSPSPRDRG